MTPTEPSAKRFSIWAFLPVVFFVGLAALLWKGLSGDPSKLPSTLIGKPVPEFSLAPITGGPMPGLKASDLKTGTVTLVNIFASWCGPCRVEHPVLMELAKRGDVRIVGINNKDSASDALQFLDTLGNPYAAIGADETGRVSIDWGGYGVPETFVVDGKGMIRYKVIGPITADELNGGLAAAIKDAQAAR